MRYEGTIHVGAFITVVVDGPGLTKEQAKKMVEENPEKYKVGPVEAIVWSGWENGLQKTEGDDD